jgi:helicase
MRFSLPDQHGLADHVLDDAILLPRAEDGSPSLTDVQFEALSAGVARSESVLVVAPTSTGKTLIGIWGLKSWLDGDPSRNVVYLVTHRALARQKFEELKSMLCEHHFDDDKTCVVLASGDTVEDGEGGLPENPLNAPLLVATYEKYLGMLSGGGIREDMSHCAVICDEMQIIGDEHRGRNIEILMTLLKMARWGQIIGLSAVLDEQDANDIANWLGIRLVRVPAREKHLLYECRTPTKVFRARTDRAEEGIQEDGSRAATDTLDIIHELAHGDRNFPVVIFCMTKPRVYALARAYAEARNIAVVPGAPLLPSLVEHTEAGKELSCFMQHRFAYHTADLLEEERELVEQNLISGQLEVVFATSTLAAGVNFPFGTAVFDSWKRWDGRARIYRPIPASEFQNMAGRVGRMGFEHEHGRVIFTSNDGYGEQRAASTYLQPDLVTSLTLRITPTSFAQIALQLLSAEICRTQEEVVEFLLGSLSALKEHDRNAAGLDHWRQQIANAIIELRQWGFIL